MQSFTLIYNISEKKSIELKLNKFEVGVREKINI